MTSTTTDLPAPVSRRPADEFHRMDRTSRRYRWWRPAVGVVAAIVGSLLVLLGPGLLPAQPGPPTELPMFGPLTDLVRQLAQISLVLPVVLAVTRWINARPAGTVFSTTGRLRWRRLGLCLLLAVPTTLTILLGSIVLLAATIHPTAPAPASDSSTAGTGLHWENLHLLPGSLAIVLGLVALQSSTEEVLTRGYLLQAVGGFLRSPWLGIAVQAVFFTVLHGLHGTVSGYTDLIGYSLLCGWLTVTTGGLEAAIALHIAWDGTLAVITVAYTVLTGHALPDGSMAGSHWQPAVVHLLGITGYAITAWLLTRRQTQRPPATSLAATDGSSPDAPPTSHLAVPQSAPADTVSDVLAHDPALGAHRAPAADTPAPPTTEPGPAPSWGGR